MKFLASEKLSAHRYKTPEGYLVCTDAILARTGKQTYRKNEIFDTQDDDEVEIDRPAEEVFNAQTVASFENKPVTVEHPAEDVNVSNYKEHAVGFARDIRRGTADGQDVLLGNLVITDGKTIEEIENGEHTELSCGYDCDVSEQDLVQRNIRGNHIALCEHGRAGIARIVDSEEKRKAEDMVKHAVDKVGRKFTLEEKGGKIVATNESGRTKEFSSWDEAEREFEKRGIKIKDDFFGDEEEATEVNDTVIDYKYEDALGDVHKVYIYGTDEKDCEEKLKRKYNPYKIIAARKIKDAREFLAYLKNAKGELGTVQHVDKTAANEEGYFTSANPGTPYRSFEEALAVSRRRGWNEISKAEWDRHERRLDSDVPNAKAHEPGMAAMDSLGLYWIFWKDSGVMSRKSIEAESADEAIRIFREDYPDVHIYSVERENEDPVENKKYEVHTRDKNGSCRVDIVRAKDYIDAVKKARNR